MAKYLAVLLMFFVTFSRAQDVSYVRYYRSADDFTTGVTMRASERRGVSHLRVYFDNRDRMLSKAEVSENGTVVEEEIYEYDFSGTLLRKSIRDGKGKVKLMYVYGGDEKISAEFLVYLFPERDLREFKDRVTVYRYLPDGRIDTYEFFGVDGTPLGSIAYDYFDSGLIREERWINEPEGRTVRLFSYDFDPVTLTYGITEYDSSGEEVSRVALIIPDDGWESKPGTEKRDSNGRPGFLEESADIIHDIRKRKAAGWDPEGLPVSPSDFIYLDRGDTLKVDLVRITDSHVRFRIVGEMDTLSVPLSQVGEIESRDGRIVYPVIY